MALMRIGSLSWRDGTGAKPVAKPPPLGFVDPVRSSGDIVGLVTRAAVPGPISSTRQPFAADESPRRLERSILTISWRDGTGAKPVAHPPPLGLVDLLRSSGDIVGFFTRAAVPEPISVTRQPLAADESPRFIKGTPPRRCVPLATHVNREYSHRSRVVQETCRSCPLRCVRPATTTCSSASSATVVRLMTRIVRGRQQGGMYVEFR